jgi:hypothetical protein
MIAEVREIRGRRWDATRREWTFPLSAIRPLRAFAEAHGLHITNAANALPDVEPVAQPRVAVNAGRFIVRFDYDPDLVVRVREIPGARWDARNKYWFATLDAAHEIGSFVIDVGAAIDDSAAPLLPAATDALQRIEASMASTSDLHITGLTGELLPFQRAGVAYALAAIG